MATQTTSLLRIQDKQFARRDFVLPIFRNLLQYINGDHPHGGIELDYLLKFDQKSYLCWWEKVFEHLQKEHHERNWFNPFTNRHVYNFIKVFPSRMIGALLFETIRRNTEEINKGLPRVIMNDQIIQILQTDWWKVPFILKPHEIDQLKTFANNTNSLLLDKLMLFVNGAEKHYEQYRIAEELLVGEFHVTDNIYHNQYLNFIDEDSRHEAVANMRYQLLVMETLLQLPGVLVSHTSNHCISSALTDSDRLPFGRIAFQTLTEFERLIQILKTSEDMFELIIAANKIKQHYIHELKSFVMTPEFQEIAERFKEMVGVPIFADLTSLAAESDISIEESLAYYGRDLFTASESAPLSRWIRTLDGEYYVDRTTVNDKGEPEPTYTRTSVGYGSVYNIVKTMSIYGMSEKVKTQYPLSELQEEKLDQILTYRETQGTGILGNQFTKTSKERTMLAIDNQGNVTVYELDFERTACNMGTYDPVTNKVVPNPLPCEGGACAIPETSDKEEDKDKPKYQCPHCHSSLLKPFEEVKQDIENKASKNDSEQSEQEDDKTSAEEDKTSQNGSESVTEASEEDKENQNGETTETDNQTP